VPICVFCFVILLYILIIPFITKERLHANKGFHSDLKPLIVEKLQLFNRIAVTVDFSESDNKAINKAVHFGNSNTVLYLIHILESTNAVVYGEDSSDLEREEDVQKLKQYQKQLQQQNITVDIKLGFGNPKQAIPELIRINNCDMLVMGTHGHKTFKDILLGTTVDSVRHSISVPLVLV
jgi:manganese transport protein